MQTYLFGSFPPPMKPFPQLNWPGPHLWIVHHAFPPSSVYATVTPLPPLSVNVEIPLWVLLLAHSLWLKGPSFPLEAQPLLTVRLAHLLRELFPLPALGSPPRHPPCGEHPRTSSYSLQCQGCSWRLRKYLWMIIIIWKVGSDLHYQNKGKS